MDKLTAIDGAANDSFGNAIAADAERVIIGSYRDDDNGSNSGAAYIYRRGPSGWEFEAKLVADDGEANDSFGISVGISGDHALVGAFWDDDNGTNAGAAYMFRYDGQQWVPQIKLLAADGAADDNFGVAVAIQGNTAVVGAQRDDDRGVDAGAVYVFMPEGDSWTQRYKLLPDENSSGDYFGAAVDIAADCLVIGAARDNQNGSQAGAVYVFERTRDEWSRDAKIVADDGSAYDEFGLAVACHGALLAVGAAQDDDLGSNSGATYLYRRVADVWVPVQKLLAADGSAGDRFGTALAVRDAEVSSVLISAPRHDEAGTDAGAAYLFQEVGSVWGQSAQLGSCDGQSYDQYGAAVTMIDDVAFIGVTGDDDNGGSSGSVYVQRTRWCPDLNDDGRVDLADLQLLLTNFHRIVDSANCLDGDVDGDCDVDIDDLLALLESYGLLVN